jgi:hypothetical protein
MSVVVYVYLSKLQWRMRVARLLLWLVLRRLLKLLLHLAKTLK